MSTDAAARKPASQRLQRGVVPIPEGVKARLEGGRLEVQGPQGTLARVLRAPGVTPELKDNTLVFRAATTRRRHRALSGTLAAHAGNMVAGVSRGFICRMKVCFSHFPIQVSVSGGEVQIANFLGEKRPRRARIVGPTKVEVKGDAVVVSGPDIEAVGQTAANIEQATRIKNYDPRVFQDGIYIVEKAQ